MSSMYRPFYWSYKYLIGTQAHTKQPRQNRCHNAIPDVRKCMFQWSNGDSDAWGSIPYGLHVLYPSHVSFSRLQATRPHVLQWIYHQWPFIALRLYPIRYGWSDATRASQSTLSINYHSLWFRCRAMASVLMEAWGSIPCIAAYGRMYAYFAWVITCIIIRWNEVQQVIMNSGGWHYWAARRKSPASNWNFLHSSATP